MTDPRPTSGPRLLHLYTGLAMFYDAQYSWKDYPSEVRKLDTIARRYGRSGDSSWLDVACGTGKHLTGLVRWYDCAGVDASAEMLCIARRRLPKVPFLRADMRSFHLHRRFGVVSCLFSAIGHLDSLPDLRRAFECMADHLLPGGVLIVEPWIAPKEFRPGQVDLQTYEGSSVTLARVSSARRRGPRSVIEYSYLIGEPGRGIRYLREADRGLMVSHGQLVSLLTDAGLRARFLHHGFTSRRGLLIGVKPEGSSAAGRPLRTSVRARRSGP